MGVPSFFSWLAKQVPGMLSPIDDRVNKDVDHLYIDFNGILYMCKQRPFEDVSTFVMDVLMYLEELVYRVSPTKTIFIAIDGVSPSAKHQQQRQRRWSKYCKKQRRRQNEMKEEEEALVEDSVDQMSFTPGTSFMKQMDEHILFGIRRLIQDNVRWQSAKVYFSPSSVPGEGEHKIMDFVRMYRKLDEQSCMNDTHIMYGMDADLIMLALSTHIENFYLLREHVFVTTPDNKYTTNISKKVQKKALSKDQKVFEKRRFQLMSINVLRRYIDHHFSDLLESYNVPFDYDLNRIIDDFVLMLFLCGNDFIPNVPTLDIAEGALDYFFGAYKRILPQLNGYITDTACSTGDTIIHFDRLRIYMQQISSLEQSVLEKRLKKSVVLKQALKLVKSESKPAETAPTVPVSNHSHQNLANSSTTGFKLLTSSINESYKNLLTTIDTAKATCVNCKGDLKRLLMVGSLVSSNFDGDSNFTNSNCVVQSDVDEQMIIKIPFKKPVTLNSIVLFSEESCPKSIKLYVDKPEIDFSSLDYLKSTQDITVASSRTFKELEVSLSPLKFAIVNHLTIFIEGNNNASSVTKLSRMTLFGQVIDLSKKTKDGKAPKDLNTIISDYRKAHDHSHHHHGKKKHVPGPCESQHESVSKHSHHEEKEHKCDSQCHHDEEKSAKRHKANDKFTLLTSLQSTDEFDVFPYCLCVNERTKYVTIDMTEWNKQYYRVKMDITSSEQVKDVVRKYCEALCFIFLYYYKGLCSWEWYYPYHYAPTATDLSTTNLDEDIVFHMGYPDTPSQQLLSILPPDSLYLLPESYKQLITEAGASRISELFPRSNEIVKIDKSKSQEWEAVLHLPFVDSHLVKQLTSNLFLTNEEAVRDERSNTYILWYDRNTQPTQPAILSTLPKKLADIEQPRSVLSTVPQDQLPLHSTVLTENVITVFQKGT